MFSCADGGVPGEQEPEPEVIVVRSGDLAGEAADLAERGGAHGGRAHHEVPAREGHEDLLPGAAGLGARAGLELRAASDPQGRMNEAPRVAICESRAGCRIERRAGRLQIAGHPEIVVVQEAHERRRSALDSRVARSGDSLVRLCDELDARVGAGDRRDEATSAVARPVVDDDQLEVGGGLSQDGADRCLDRAAQRCRQGR